MVSRAFHRAKNRRLNRGTWNDTDEVTHKAKHRAFQVYLAGGGGMKAVRLYEWDMARWGSSDCDDSEYDSEYEYD